MLLLSSSLPFYPWSGSPPAAQSADCLFSTVRSPQCLLAILWALGRMSRSSYRATPTRAHGVGSYSFPQELP